MNKLLGLDLCAGLRGASSGWDRSRWDVVTLDIEPSFNPDIVADLRSWSWCGARPDLLWVSFPCDEFARESMPWCATGNDPDLSIYHAAVRIRDECNPRFWVFENVRGAQKWIGKSTVNYGAFHLWTNIPLHKFSVRYRKKESFGSKQAAERALVPGKVSKIVSGYVESLIALPGF